MKSIEHCTFTLSPPVTRGNMFSVRIDDFLASRVFAHISHIEGGPITMNMHVKVVLNTIINFDNVDMIVLKSSLPLTLASKMVRVQPE